MLHITICKYIKLYLIFTNYFEQVMCIFIIVNKLIEHIFYRYYKNLIFYHKIDTIKIEELIKIIH